MQEDFGGRRPNVLVIMTDQHRADLMSCAGNDLVPTPNIDRIASAGVRFTDAYCPYPVCVASRMSLLTGLYAHNTGAVNNTDRLDRRFRTVAHHFAASGYLTALIGKMHFNDAHKHGFEYHLSINDWLMYLGPKAGQYAEEIANHPIAPFFFDSICDDGSGFPDVSGLWDRGASPWRGRVGRRSFDSMASSLEPEDHLDAFVARETAKLMGRHRDETFFLVASFMKPHPPFYPPRKWAEMYPVGAMTLPEPGDPRGYPEHVRARIADFRAMGESRLRAHRAGYLGNLAFVDTCIGVVVDALEELGLTERTILVYTSDHGEMDGDHGLYQKFCLFEPSVKVPLIVSVPGRAPRGRTASALTEYLGLYPTLAELAGLPRIEGTRVEGVERADLPGAPEGLDGRSFATVVMNPDAAGPDAAFSEYALRSTVPQYMVRTRRYKYVHNDGARHELYDLEADPGEMVNRVDDAACRGVRAELGERLAAWYQPSRNPFRDTEHRPKQARRR